MSCAPADESCCPGGGKTGGVQWTAGSTNTDAWTCTHCQMSWAISLVNHGQLPTYFQQLAATVQEVDRLRWLLGQVVTLADDAPTLADVDLRDRLLALAESCAP